MGGRLLFGLVSESDVNRCCSFYDQVAKTESADNVLPMEETSGAKAAVLLSVPEYERMVNRLQQLELLAKATRVSARITAGREETISHEALKRQILARRAHEAVPHVDD